MFNLFILFRNDHVVYVTTFLEGKQVIAVPIAVSSHVIDVKRSLQGLCITFIYIGFFKINNN